MPPAHRHGAAIFLSRGCNAGARFRMTNAMTSPDERLADAVRTGDRTAVLAALQAGASARAVHDYEQVQDRERLAGRESLLQLAVRSGHHDVAAVLLEQGADPDACDSLSGRSPLVDAAASGDLRTVALLLAAHASLRPDPERPHADPFAAAVDRGHAAVAAALARAGARATPRALELACHRGRTDLAELCLQHGASLAGADVLATAARAGSVPMLQWLVERGADVGTTGGDALCEAANAGQTAAVELLLTIGAPHAHRNSYSWTPLHFAAYQAGAATVEALLRAGADPLADDGQQRTPLDWAREAGRTDNITLLERAMRGA